MVMKLYKCNYCENQTASKYDIDIQTEFDGPDGHSEWREWPYRLCPECYANWYSGAISTEKVAEVCGRSIRRGASYIRQEITDMENDT